jgi:hypothetical protein
MERRQSSNQRATGITIRNPSGIAVSVVKITYQGVVFKHETWTPQEGTLIELIFREEVKEDSFLFIVQRANERFIGATIYGGSQHSAMEIRASARPCPGERSGYNYLVPHVWL